jgi:hypothetical protein
MTDRRLFLAQSFATAFFVSYHSLAIASGKPYPLRFTEGSRLLLDARVNGQTVTALLDSAAEASFLDKAFAERIGVIGGESVTARGSGKGTQDASLVSGVTLEAAGVTLKDQTVAVLDLSDIGRRLLKGPLDFVLGRELFDNARLEIDIEGLTIRVADPGAEPPGVRFPLESSHGVETFPIIIEGRTALAAFDLGNGSNPLIGSKFAGEAHLLTDGRAITNEKGGGIGGEMTRQVVTLKSLEVAGQRFENVPAAIDESEHADAANVGVSILRHFLITTDFKAKAIWLSPRKE